MNLRGVRESGTVFAIPTYGFIASVYLMLGVDFVPVRFRPAFGKHAGRICGGVYLRGFDATAVHAVKLGAYVLQAFKKVAPDAWTWRADAYEFVTDKPAIDLLWGSGELRECIDQGGDLDALLEKADAQAQAFRA